MRITSLKIFLVALVIAAIAIPASADSISIGQGQTVTLTYSGSNTGYSGTAALTLNGNSLTITLSNTGSAGSFISAIGLNTTPNISVGSTSFSGGLTGFAVCTTGCGLGGNLQVAWNGNGSPNGLQAGQTGTITYTFTSSPTNPNPLMIDFNVVHFQGLGQSEKLTNTPEPASLFLLGTGLLSAGGLVRRRLRKA